MNKIVNTMGKSERGLRSIIVSRLLGKKTDHYAEKKAPFFLVSGPCVIENELDTLYLAERLYLIGEKLNIPVVFKTSFDKANRQSCGSYRGPGLDESLKIFEKIKENCGNGENGLLLTTDIHESYQADQVANIVDIIQIPSFLCRQTSLIQAAAATGSLVNIKKGQFASAETMLHSALKVKKIQDLWTPDDDHLNRNSELLDRDNAELSRHVLLTERGSFFGYEDLVMDPRNLIKMKTNDTLVIQDVTHTVQNPGSNGVSKGTASFIPVVAKAAAAIGVDGMFFETHRNPEKALCDSSGQLHIDKLEDLLKNLIDIGIASKENDYL